MKKLALAMACVLAVGIAQADDKGGFSQDAAPPPPHKLDDGYRGVEDGRIMTVEQAKTMHDGATVYIQIMRDGKIPEIPEPVPEIQRVIEIIAVKRRRRRGKRMDSGAEYRHNDCQIKQRRASL